jgi:hypothetical protein
MTYQLWILLDDLPDTLPRESLLAETHLDIVQDLGVGRVGLVQDILQLQVRRAETIAEMLCEDPATVCDDQQSAVQEKTIKQDTQA